MEKQTSNETVKRTKSHLSCSVPKDYITKYLNILLFLFRISVKANYSISSKSTSNTSSIYLLKVNNRNTWTRWKTRSKLTIRKLERRQWRRFGVFIVNLRPISHLVLVFLLILIVGWKCYCFQMLLNALFFSFFKNHSDVSRHLGRNFNVFCYSENTISH